MPDKYVVEMFMDRVAASKVYLKDKYTRKAPLEYYRNGRASGLLHPEVRALLEKLLVMLAKRGEKETFAYIRRVVLGKPKRRGR